MFTYIFIFIYNIYVCICILDRKRGASVLPASSWVVFTQVYQECTWDSTCWCRALNLGLEPLRFEWFVARYLFGRHTLPSTCFFWKCVARYLARFKRKNINMPDLYRLFFFHSCLVVKMPILPLPLSVSLVCFYALDVWSRLPDSG